MSSPAGSSVIERFRSLVAIVAGRDHLEPGDRSGARRNEFIRFLVAGGVNTLFGFAVYSACILAGLSVWLSLLTGMLAGTVFNFFTTGGYAFRQLSLGRFPRFVACYLFIYGLNLVLIDMLSAWMDSKIVAQAIITIPMALLSYYLMSRWVFFSR